MARNERTSGATAMLAPAILLTGNARTSSQRPEPKFGMNTDQIMHRKPTKRATKKSANGSLDSSFIPS